MDKFWQGKNVLITGANGFLGSHLTLELLRRKAKVIAIIKEDLKLSLLKIESAEIDKKGLTIIKSDITISKSMLEIFGKYRPDICLHIAAQPIVGIANKSPLNTFTTNIVGTWNILEAARLNDIKAVVVASSDKAYGEHKKLPYREDASLVAKHPYDSSKACADILTRCYAHTYGLNTAVTRCANIYGPGDFNFSRIIPDTMRSIILHKNPIVRSNGAPLRDYIFIDDVVEAYLCLAESLHKGKINVGEAFNFGSGKPISVLSLVNKILKIAKCDLAPKILSKKKIKGEIDRQYLSSGKAKELLGWKTSCSLNDGLKVTYDWYKKHLEC